MKPRNVDREDPKIAAVLDAFAADRRLAAIAKDYRARRKTGTSKFGSNALRVNGKLFALFVRGTLVVKLPKKRVDALVDAGLAEYFDPGHGRRMKQWATVRSPSLSWVELATEAHQFVRDAGA